MIEQVGGTERVGRVRVRHGGWNRESGTDVVTYYSSLSTSFF